MHDVWKERWEVQSLSLAGTKYTVARKKDGAMGCSCPAWKFHKAPKPHCKHIISILEALDSVIRRSRIFLDSEVPFSAAQRISFPSAAVVEKIMGRSNTAMQVTVAGEQFQVRRVFLEE